MQDTITLDRPTNLFQDSTPPELPHTVRISIAQLTDLEITGMNEVDLINVIEMADIRPVDRKILRALDFRRITDLRRIVMATRTACRDYWLRFQERG